jgi:hypothetical protein
MKGASDALSHGKKLAEESVAKFSSESISQMTNRSDSQESCHTSGRISRREQARSRSNRRLRQELKKQLQADFLMQIQEKDDEYLGSRRFPPVDSAEKIRRQPLSRTRSSPTAQLGSTVDSGGGLFPPTLQETIDRIAASPSLVVDDEGGTTPPVSLWRPMHASPGQHALLLPVGSESMSTPKRSILRCRSDSASKTSQKSCYTELADQPSPDSSDTSPPDDKPRRRLKSSKSSGSSTTPRRRSRRTSIGSSTYGVSLSSFPSSQSSSACGDETAGRRRKSKSRSSTEHDARNVNRPRRERGDSAPSIPVRKTRSENSSEEGSPGKPNDSGRDDHWDSDSMGSTCQRKSGHTDSSSSTIISKSTGRGSSQAPRRSQSLIERQREVTIPSTDLGLDAISVLAVKAEPPSDKVRLSFRKPRGDCQIAVPAPAKDVTAVDLSRPSMEKPTKELTRGHRFGIPRISKSFSVKPRTDDKGSESVLNNCKRQSRSPSLTSIFRIGVDSSSRSTTQRTASTASTEQSSVSYESPVPVAQPENETMAKNEHLFGKLFTRLRDELDNPLTVHCDGEMNVLCPPSLPSRGMARKRGKRNGTTEVSLYGIERSSDKSPREATSKEGTYSTKDRGNDEESDIESVSTVLEDEVTASKIPCRQVHPEKRHTVGFGTVTIREYARSVGDNPSVSSGTPIGLGWSYFEPTVVNVDSFETVVRKPGPRTRKDFHLTAQKRFHLLLDEWGYTVQEIGEAKKDAAEIRKLRQISVFGDGEVQSMSQYSSNMNMGSTLVPRGQDRWDATPTLLQR